MKVLQGSAHGAYSVHGPGGGFVAHPADRACRKGLRIDDAQTERLSRLEPGTHLAAGEAGAPEVKNGARARMVRPPARDPVAHLGAIVLPALAKATLQILDFVPFRNACAVNDGHRGRK